MKRIDLAWTVGGQRRWRSERRGPSIIALELALSNHLPLSFRHPDRYRIACALARTDDGAAFGPLGRALDLCNNELFHHLRLLERAGLIERDHPPGRTRPTILTLTSSGRAALAQHGAVLARLAAEAEMAG